MRKRNPFVFLSYTADGADAMNSLKAELSSHGVEYWEWSEQMIAGDDLARFGREVEGADFFVPIISPNYRNRSATNRELSLAFHRELKLKETIGHNFSFVLPLITSDFDDLPDEIKDRYAVRTPEAIRKAVQIHSERIMLKNDPYSFSDWPGRLLDENGSVDVLTVIGHSGKEAKPTPADVKNLKPPLDLGIECRNQSHRIAEYLPHLVKYLDAAANQVRSSKGLTYSSVLDDSFQCHVDWHVLRFHQDRLRNQNIISLGAGDTNLVSRWIISAYHENLPIKFDSPTGSQTLFCDAAGALGATIVDSIETDMQRYGARLLIVPNPLNESKVAVVAAGLTALGTQAAILALCRNSNDLRFGGAYHGNYARVLIGEERDWRAVGFRFVR